MKQISEYMYMDSLLDGLEIPNKLLPNPYYSYPYLVIDDFLKQEDLQAIYSEIETSEDFILAMLRNQNLESVVDEHVRKTHIYKLSCSTQKIYDDAFARHQQTIEKFFSKVIFYSTQVQVLGYEKGFFYKAHSDDSSFVVDKEGTLIGFKLVAHNRKITTVCFLNDNFSGGELEFNFLRHEDGSPAIVKPKAGALIAFASNAIFTHEVKCVNDGFRVTLVQWHDAL